MKSLLRRYKQKQNNHKHMKALIIYHRADFDGIASGVILDEFVSCYGSDTALYGWDYGDPVAPVLDLMTSPAFTNIYMADICIDQVMELNDPRLIWIDHHKTAIEKWEGKASNITRYVIDGVAACRLCYAYLAAGFPLDLDELTTKEDFINRNVFEPLALTLLGEWDVWDKRDPRAELLQFGIKAAPDAAVAIRGMLFGLGLVDSYLLAGERCKQYQKNCDAIVLDRTSRVITLMGHTLLSANFPVGNSLSFDAAPKPPNIDGLMMYRIGHDGMAHISLYGVQGKPDVDLSEIAKYFGGGGHKQACGFRITVARLQDILGIQR